MSDGTINMPNRATKADSPAANRMKWYFKAGKPYKLDENDVETPLSVEELSDLLDVDTTGVEDGDFLVYNNANSRFEAGQTAASIFGCSNAEASNNVFDSNGSTAYENHVTLVAEQCVANKKYRIGAFAIYNASVTNNDVEIQITADEGSGEVEIGKLKVEVKESGTDNEVPTSGFFYYTPTTGGNVTVRINYRMQNGEGTAYMFYSAVEWWRVGL